MEVSKSSSFEKALSGLGEHDITPVAAFRIGLLEMKLKNL